MTGAATLTVTTWNIGAGTGKTKAADLDALAEVSQVICCQEGGDRQPLLTGWAKRTGWGLFAGTTGGGPKVPILTHPDVRVVDARTVIAVGRFHVGGPGAGPAWLQRKAINLVTLAVAGGDELHVLNTHMVASVTRSKLPNAWLRRRHYRRHMAALCTLIDSLDGPVVVCGDFNAEPGFDLLAPLLDRVDLVPSGPTRGSRRIDFIGVRDLKHVDDAAIRETSSDHRAVAATLTLPEVPTMPAPVKYDFAKILRAADLKVVEIDGWRTRGRPAYTGGFDPVGVLWHHTGGPGDGKDYAEWLAKVGRPDLPPPLCQLSVGRDGTWYVIAAGRANHAGEARASGTVAAGDGNELYIGVECMNTGTEGWSEDQYDSMVRGGAALGKALGTSVQTQRAHYETSTTGKWDPGDPKGKRLGNNRVLDMDAFRARINALMTTTPKPSAPSRGDRPDAVIESTKANIAELQKALAVAEKTGQPKRAEKLQAAIEEQQDSLDALLSIVPRVRK